MERNIAIPFLVVTIIASFLIIGVHCCARGCMCVGRNKWRAVCRTSYRFSRDSPVFVEPITSLETHGLLFKDLAPYFNSLNSKLKEVIVFPLHVAPRWEDKVPDRLFRDLKNVEKLTIRTTRDRLTPMGFADAMRDLPALKAIEVRGNSIPCDCEIPDLLATRRIFVMEISKTLPVTNCLDEDGFSSTMYGFKDFQEECAQRGGYTLPDFPEWADYVEKDQPTAPKKQDKFGVKMGKGMLSVKKPSIPTRLNSSPKSHGGHTKIGANRHMWGRRRGRSVGADTSEGLGVDEEPVNFERSGPIVEGTTTDVEEMAQPPVDPESNAIPEVSYAQNTPSEFQDLDLPERFLGYDNDQNREQDLVPDDVGPEHSRPHGEHHSGNRDHTPGVGYGTAQLALLQLPMNDLTIRLNPYDPFEVDLFFQYVLHKNNHV